MSMTLPPKGRGENNAGKEREKKISAPGTGQVPPPIGCKPNRAAGARADLRVANVGHPDRPDAGNERSNAALSHLLIA